MPKPASAFIVGYSIGTVTKVSQSQKHWWVIKQCCVRKPFVGLMGSQMLFIMAEVPGCCPSALTPLVALMDPRGIKV